jgi:hypothetical protein
LVDFYKSQFQDGFAHIASYAAFVVISVAGPLLRLAAADKRFTELRRPPRLGATRVAAPLELSSPSAMRRINIVRQETCGFAAK